MHAALRSVASFIACAALASAAAHAQTYHSGQNLQPVFEGWEQNPDGSFNMVFGYLNRNFEEHLNLPVGEANYFEPGDPDRGQPTFFYPRRQRFSFRVRVPADWGDQELVWTVTAHGRTDSAVGWLVPEQIIDDQVVAMNRSGGGAPDIQNHAPSITLVERAERSVKVGDAADADRGHPGRRGARNATGPSKSSARPAQRPGAAGRLDPASRARRGDLRSVDSADGRPRARVDAAAGSRGGVEQSRRPVSASRARMSFSAWRTMAISTAPPM